LRSITARYCVELTSLDSMSHQLLIHDFLLTDKTYKQMILSIELAS